MNELSNIFLENQLKNLFILSTNQRKTKFLETQNTGISRINALFLPVFSKLFSLTLHTKKGSRLKKQLLADLFVNINNHTLNFDFLYQYFEHHSKKCIDFIDLLDINYTYNDLNKINEYIDLIDEFGTDFLLSSKIPHLMEAEIDSFDEVQLASLSFDSILDILHEHEYSSLLTRQYIFSSNYIDSIIEGKFVEKSTLIDLIECLVFLSTPCILYTINCIIIDENSIFFDKTLNCKYNILATCSYDINASFQTNTSEIISCLDILCYHLKYLRSQAI